MSFVIIALSELLGEDLKGWILPLAGQCKLLMPFVHEAGQVCFSNPTAQADRVYLAFARLLLRYQATGRYILTKYTCLQLLHPPSWATLGPATCSEQRELDPQIARDLATRPKPRLPSVCTTDAKNTPQSVAAGYVICSQNRIKSKTCGPFLPSGPSLQHPPTSFCETPNTTKWKLSGRG